MTALQRQSTKLHSFCNGIFGHSTGWARYDRCPAGVCPRVEWPRRSTADGMHVKLENSLLTCRRNNSLLTFLGCNPIGVPTTSTIGRRPRLPDDVPSPLPPSQPRPVLLRASKRIGAS